MPRSKDEVQKFSTSIRLSAEAKSLLDKLAQNLGVSQSAILELAIREKAKREKVE